MNEVMSHSTWRELWNDLFGARARARRRLAQSLDDRLDALVSDRQPPIQPSKLLFVRLSDRLGRAGYISTEDRRAVCRCGGLMAIALLSCAAGCLYYWAGMRASCVGVVLGSYFVLCCGLGFLRVRERQVARTVLFELPLLLESILLLVESGYGLLPALERVVSSQDRGAKLSVLGQVFNSAFHISAAGIPFPQVLESVAAAVPHRVLRHVLLHLDLSVTEGAELVPSLRSLSEHTHTEWRLSVEHRVRRLENWVVFPVFGAVVGMVLLLAAVPLVPLLSLNQQLQARPPVLDRNVPEPLSSTLEP